MLKFIFNFVRSREHLSYTLLYLRDIIKPKKLEQRPITDFWKKRIDDVLICKDNAFIPRVPNAGSINKDVQIMYNGLKIRLGSYYGSANHIAGQHKLLEANKGVHEPQEERVFHEVLQWMPPQASMIELGAFWSFYSMCFNKAVSNSFNYMIEPVAENLYCGKRNFQLNNMKGDFTQAYLGQQSDDRWYSIKTVCIDDFVKRKKIQHVNLLHSDIQGYEYEMLLGAEKTIKAKMVDYIFISTHSNELHANCRDFLEKHNFVVIADADLDQTFSYDGLIVARRADLVGLGKVEIDLKQPQK